MVTRAKRSSPEKRIQLGQAVLDAARKADTAPVKDRLERFERVHGEYVDAQQHVEAAEAQLATTRTQVEACSTRQEKAVETLARAVVSDGQSRANPFEAFGAPPPSEIVRPPVADAAKAVHDVVAKIQANETSSKKTIEAARAADKAARSVEQAVAAFKKAKDGLRSARRMRDTVGESWESGLTALRRVASAVAEEGAPDLYVKLFPPVARAAPKGKAEEQTPSGTAVTPGPGPVPTQTAA